MRPFSSVLLILILYVAIIGLGANAFGAEKPRFPNLAHQKKLPEGDGLATEFLGDTGINKQADVIFADDFETGNIGAAWDETANKMARC
jgi:hypothetical protein